MSSKRILRKLRSLVIENKDNRKKINNLFGKLRDEEMMKKIKMKYVGFKI